MSSPDRRIMETVITLPPTPRKAAIPQIGIPQPSGSGRGRGCEARRSASRPGRNPGRSRRSITVTPMEATNSQPRNHIRHEERRARAGCAASCEEREQSVPAAEAGEHAAPSR